MSAPLRRLGRATLLALAAVYGLFPIYYITVQSLKTPQEDVFGNPLYVRHPTFENYTELFQEGRARCAATSSCRASLPPLDGQLGGVLAATLAVTLTPPCSPPTPSGAAAAGLAWWRRVPLRGVRRAADDPVHPALPGRDRGGLDDSLLALA